MIVSGFLVSQMAEITYVDVLWPSCGHASENPELPDILQARGSCFLDLLLHLWEHGEIRSVHKLIAQAAEIPTLA